MTPDIITQPEQWPDVLDRVGTFLDDILLPVLGAWLIYVLKGLLIQATERFRPKGPDK